MKRRASRLTLLATISVITSNHFAYAQSAPAAQDSAPAAQKGAYLEDHGINLSSFYNGEFAANPSGGARQGAEFTGELNLGADIDLNRLAGLPGAQLHVIFTDRAGNSLAAKSINNSVSVQQIYGGGQTYQLSKLVYEQQLFDGRVKFEVGRIAENDAFVSSKLYCEFQSNNICGNPSFLGTDTQATFYPTPTWGGWSRVYVLPDFYVKGGAFESNPKVQNNPTQGHGFNWSLNGANGVILPLEVGYSETPPGAEVDNRADIGVIFDRTPYQAAYYNATAPDMYGRTTVYAQAQGLLYQPYAGQKQGLYGFTTVMIGASGQHQIAGYYAAAGLVYQGPFTSRPSDTIGFMASDVSYNSDYLNSLYAQRVNEGGTQRPYKNLTMIELNYAAQLTPWLNLMPNLQYIVHPDGLGALNYPVANEKNAFVIGAQFIVNVGKLVGLSRELVLPDETPPHNDIF